MNVVQSFCAYTLFLQKQINKTIFYLTLTNIYFGSLTLSFTGIYTPSGRSNRNKKLELEEEKIRSKQIEAAVRLQKFVNKYEKKLNQHNKVSIIEEIEDELRAYIKTYYETSELLPAWPDSVPIIFTDDAILGLPPISTKTTFKKNNTIGLGS